MALLLCIPLFFSVCLFLALSLSLSFLSLLPLSLLAERERQPPASRNGQEATKADNGSDSPAHGSQLSQRLKLSGDIPLGQPLAHNSEVAVTPGVVRSKYLLSLPMTDNASRH